MKNKLTVAEVKKQLRERGMILRRTPVPGEFMVSRIGARISDPSNYFTDDLQDALNTGLAISAASGITAQ